MPRISKNNSVHSGKKNVDITGLINNNQTGSGKNNVKNIKKTNKKHKDNYDDSEFGSDNSDLEEDEEDEEDEEENEEENELDDNANVDNANDDNNSEKDDNDDNNSEKDDNDDNYSEKSEKESNAGDVGDDEVGDDDKNYIDDEEALKTKCYSKYAKVDYDDLDLDEMFGDEPFLLDKNIRVSKPVLTKYEFVRLLTDRTKQLAQGAKHMLKNTQELSSKEIAKLEIKESVIPLIIERPIPNSKSERWKVSELQIPEHFFSM